MATTRWAKAFGGGMVLLLIVAALAARAADSTMTSSLPRYDLAVGQRLTYEFAEENRYEQYFPTRESATWQFWVIDKDDRGTHRIVATRLDTRDPSPFNHGAAEFELDSDGTIRWGETRFGLAHVTRLHDFFPRLPHTDEELRDGWTAEDPFTGDTWKYRDVVLAEGLSFRADHEAPIMSVAGGYFQCEYVANARTGLLSEAAFRAFAANYSEVWETHIRQGTFETLDSATVSRFRADWEHYSQAATEFRRRSAQNLAYGELARAEAGSPGAVERAFQEAEADLRNSIAGVETPELRTLLENELAKSAKRREYSRLSISRLAKLIDQPAPDWTGTDLNGNKHSLEDYRGQILILDFWFRNCNYCIRMAPQVRRVEEHFEGQPVAIVGMNVDEDLEDARVTASVLELRHPTIVNMDEVRRSYQANCPTHVVIDAGGRIREMIRGYSATLEYDLIRTVEALLAEQSGKDK